MLTDAMFTMLRELGATHYTSAHNFTGSSAVSSYHFFIGESMKEVAYYMPCMHFYDQEMSGFCVVERDNPIDSKNFQLIHFPRGI